jgi:hypothetical protein
MTIFNLLLENNDILFYGLFTGIGGIIGWSWYSKSMGSNVLDTVYTSSKGTMTSPITDLTITPRTFSFSRGQLRHIENNMDQAVQTEPSLDGLFTTISEKGVQAVSDVTNIGIQVNPPLTVDTSALDVVSVFRNINVSDLSSVFIKKK